MKLYYLPLGAYGTNCYIAHNEADNTCLVTDPGDEGEKLKDILESHNFKVQAILLTHGHSDHILGPYKHWWMPIMYRYTSMKEMRRA